jgi:ankyrin repeat protein
MVGLVCLLLLLGACSPLYQATIKNDPQLLEKAIQEGADVNFQLVKVDPTPLILAIDRGNTEIVKGLLNAGADPNQAQHSGALRGGGIARTPLIIAAQKGNLAITKLLLEAEANTDLVDEKNQSPLLWAASKNFPEIVSLLLQNKANPGIKENTHGQTALNLAVINQYKQTAEILLKSGASPNIPSNDGSFPLAEAVVKQDTDLVNLLIEHGADPNITNKNGVSPLIFAAGRINAEIADNLIENGANINHTSELGHTPLMTAVLSNNIGMVKSLVAKGANLDIVETTHGTTPLLQAAIKKYYDIAEYLVKNGANVDITPYNGIALRQHALNTNDNKLLELARFNPESIRLEKLESTLDDELKKYQERNEQYFKAKNEYENNEYLFLNSLRNEQLELYSIYTDKINDSSENMAKVLLSFRKFSGSLDEEDKNIFIRLYSEKQHLDTDLDLLNKMDQNLVERKKALSDLKEEIAVADNKAATEERQARELAYRNQQQVIAAKNAQAAQSAQNTIGMLSILTSGLNTYNSIQTQKYNAQAQAYRTYSNQYESNRQHRELINSINGIEDSITRARRGLY